jgi:glycosyltransferase involved in cell wall biosynthesis
MLNENLFKKKLLIYSDCYIYGGSERLLSSIILSQTIKSEYDIYFAYRRHKTYEEGLADDYGLRRKNFYPLLILSNDSIFHKINTMSLPGFVKKIIKTPFWLLRIIGLYAMCNFLVMYFFVKKIKPSVIHINNGGYPGAASCNILVLAAKITGTHNIIYQINNIAYPSKTGLSKWIDKNIINVFVKYFITASRKARQSLFQNRNFSLDKIILVPNTVPAKSVVHNRSEILRELSWPENCFFICQVAFLSKRKGQIFLLEALRIIKIDAPEIFKKLRLVLVGNGEDEKMLKKNVRDNKLGANVVFSGYRPDYVDFINACDVFVLPSIANEDMPLVILEAMKLEKTIIASRFAGIEEEIESGVSGVLLDPNPITLPSSIAEIIIDLHNNGYQDYGLNAKKRYINYFSPEQRSLKLIEAYNLILNNGNFK